MAKRIPDGQLNWFNGLPASGLLKRSGDGQKHWFQGLPYDSILQPTVTTTQTQIGKSLIDTATTKTKVQLGSARIQVTQTVLPRSPSIPFELGDSLNGLEQVGRSRVQQTLNKDQLGRVTISSNNSVGTAKIGNNQKYWFQGLPTGALSKIGNLKRSGEGQRYWFQGLPYEFIVPPFPRTTDGTLLPTNQYTLQEIFVDISTSFPTMGSLSTSGGQSSNSIDLIGQYVRKTVSYFNDIAATRTKTQIGVSTISQPVSTQTQVGVARIQVTTTKTQTGVSTITPTTQWSQLGVARIQIQAIIKTQTGVSRIQLTDTQTQTGHALVVIGIFRLGGITNPFNTRPFGRSDAPPVTKFYKEVIVNTMTPVVGVSGFSGTLAGITFVSSDLTVYGWRYTSIVRLIPTVLATDARDAFFQCDGRTDIAIDTVHAALGNPYANGSGTMEITAQRTGDGFLDITGHTDIDIDWAEHDSWQGDGRTDVAITAEQIHAGQIHMDGSTDVVNDGGSTTDLRMDGDTEVEITPSQIFAGTITMEGIGTFDVATTQKQANASLNMDGFTDFAMTPVQDQFGEIVIAPIEQDFSPLASYVFEDGHLDTTVVGTFSVNGTLFAIGPDYLSGVEVNTVEIGSPNFLPVFTDSFTLSSKTSRSIGTGEIGIFNYSRLLGFSRAVPSLDIRVLRTSLRQEEVRIPLFVSEAIDFTQMSDSLGFSLSSKTAQAGFGLIGRDREHYATFSLLTNLRETQATLEALATGDPQILATQVVYELLWTPPSNAVATQAVAEVLYLANIAVINQESVESLHDAVPTSWINQLVVEMMHSIKAFTQGTQITAEALATGDPSTRGTNINVEVLTRNDIVQFSAALIQQDAVEGIHNSERFARINQEVVEVIHNMARRAWINQEAVETIHNNDRNGLIQQDAVETLHDGQGNGVVNEVAIEMLVRSAFDGTVGGMVSNPKYHI